MIKKMWLHYRCCTCVWVCRDTSKTCCCSCCKIWCFTIEGIRNVENTHYSGRLFGNHSESVAIEWEVIVFTSASAEAENTKQPIDTCNSNLQKCQHMILPRAPTYNLRVTTLWQSKRLSTLQMNKVWNGVTEVYWKWKNDKGAEYDLNMLNVKKWSE